MKHTSFNTRNLVAVVMTVAMFFSSCEKECKTGCIQQEPDLIEKVSFNLLGRSVAIEMEINTGVMNNYHRTAAFVRKSEEELFQFIKEYCLAKSIAHEGQAMLIALYYDTLLSQSLCVIDENIRAVSLYSVEGKQITHRLFVKNEMAEFYEMENVKVAVPYITPYQVDFYLENYVFTNLQNRSAIFISGDFANEVWKNAKKYKRTPLRYEISCNSEKGKSYVDYYYFLTQEYRGNISISLAIQTALFFRDFNSIMNAFANPKEHLSEIMFDDKLTDSLMNLLDQYEKITYSEEGKDVLGTIRKDIKMFQNKKLQDILSIIS